MTDCCALALEASSDRLGLAARRGQQVEYFEAQPARTATADVYAHARELLGRLGAGFADLDYVAFGRGPGSFTGVRVAAAVAQALAYARVIPVCRISSLAVLAAGAGPGLHAICVDARMGRAYAALYQVRVLALPPKRKPDRHAPNERDQPLTCPHRRRLGYECYLHPLLPSNDDRYRGHRSTRTDRTLQPANKVLLDA